MAAKAVHSMVRVRDEARSVGFYEKAFGLSVADRFPFPDFTLVYMRNAQSPFEVELTVNGDRDKPYDLGDGYGHLAVSVDTIEEEHARLAAAGLSPGEIKELKHEGKALARFFFISDPDGYKIEVIQRGGRFV